MINRLGVTWRRGSSFFTSFILSSSIESVKLESSVRFQWFIWFIRILSGFYLCIYHRLDCRRRSPILVRFSSPKKVSRTVSLLIKNQNKFLGIIIKKFKDSIFNLNRNFWNIVTNIFFDVAISYPKILTRFNH